jgi:hypothetical protein
MLDGENMSLNALISDLDTFRETVNVNIRLVGFDGDGNQAVNLNEVLSLVADCSIIINIASSE